MVLLPLLEISVLVVMNIKIMIKETLVFLQLVALKLKILISIILEVLWEVALI